MLPITKIRIRRSNGPKGGWRLVLVGHPHRDKSIYQTFEAALDSAIFRLRRRAMDNLYDDLMHHTPRGEYVGLHAKHVHGDTLQAKRRNLALKGRQLGLRLDVHLEDDGVDGHVYYVRIPPPIRPRIPGQQGAA
jgi:hypothetical protein